MQKIGIYMYKTAHISYVITDYLKPLYENNNFIIKNTEDFAQLIHEQPSLVIHKRFDSGHHNNHFRRNLHSY